MAEAVAAENGGHGHEEDVGAGVENFDAIGAVFIAPIGCRLEEVIGMGEATGYYKGGQHDEAGSQPVHGKTAHERQIGNVAGENLGEHGKDDDELYPGGQGAEFSSYGQILNHQTEYGCY